MEFVQYLMGLGPLQQVGVAGFLVYVAAFGGVQFGWLDGNGASYTAANMLAASLVAISLLEHFNLASALTQGTWIAIGGIGLLRRLPGAPAQSVARPDADPAARRRLAAFLRAQQGRRQLASLAEHGDHTLADMGITHGDVRAALAAPRHEDPTRRLAHLAAHRRASRMGRTA